MDGRTLWQWKSCPWTRKTMSGKAGGSQSSPSGISTPTAHQRNSDGCASWHNPELAFDDGSLGFEADFGEEGKVLVELAGAQRRLHQHLPHPRPRLRLVSRAVRVSPMICREWRRWRTEEVGGLALGFEEVEEVGEAALAGEDDDVLHALPLHLRLLSTGLALLLASWRVDPTGVDVVEEGFEGVGRDLDVVDGDEAAVGPLPHQLLRKVLAPGAQDGLFPNSLPLSIKTKRKAKPCERGNGRRGRRM